MCVIHVYSTASDQPLPPPQCVPGGTGTLVPLHRGSGTQHWDISIDQIDIVNSICILCIFPMHKIFTCIHARYISCKDTEKSPKLTSAKQYIKRNHNIRMFYFPCFGYTASNRSFDSHPSEPQGSLCSTCMISQAKDQPQPSVSTADISLAPQGAESDRTR